MTILVTKSQLNVYKDIWSINHIANNVLMLLVIALLVNNRLIILYVHLVIVIITMTLARMNV